MIRRRVDRKLKRIQRLWRVSNQQRKVAQLSNPLKKIPNQIKIGKKELKWKKREIENNQTTMHPLKPMTKSRSTLMSNKYQNNHQKAQKMTLLLRNLIKIRLILIFRIGSWRILRNQKRVRMLKKNHLRLIRMRIRLRRMRVRGMRRRIKSPNTTKMISLIISQTQH